MKQIYLVFNASTPIAPEVAEAMRPFLAGHFGNPSSSHWAGVQAKEAVENARFKVANLLGCGPDEIVFTSGGTESNNHAVKGTFFALRDRGNHIITTRVEHPSVIHPCQFLETLGAHVTYLPVDGKGMVDPDHVRQAITDQTILISVMHANNEVGTIQPIAEIGRITRERGILFHTDAAQSVGKISTRVDKLGVDLLSLAGHKVYAPKGVGALYIRHGVHVEPFVHGGGHESGRRAGTENVLLDIGLGTACQLAAGWTGRPEIRKLRDMLWERLCGSFGSRVILNGHPTERLPNTLNVSFTGRNGAEIVSKLDGVAVSTGSACHEGTVSLSPILEAMAIPPEIGMGAVRFSLGRTTTETEISDIVDRLEIVVV
ncbi:MAG: cysteine desulfurase family protein [bacterium]|nr:cysteine desulfurase family protein [bacterium]